MALRDSAMSVGTDSPRPMRSPNVRLRLRREKQVTVRSPSPLRPAKVSGRAVDAEVEATYRFELR